MALNPLHVLVGGALVLVILLGFILDFVFAPKKAASTPAAAKAPSEKKTFTAEEVAKHNTREDVWVILKGKVYDVSGYVEEHPGGDAILKNAGGDSTKEFWGPQHPARVFDMIDDFYIGDLVETKKGK